MAMLPKPKVLVIDDELGPRESLRILLKNDYTVYCASSVDQGIEYLADAKPDVVVLDIRMPDKSGIDGLREIRKIDPVVSVIMLTGYGALETAQKALRLGANDYVKKPFETTEMLELIERYVERTEVERKAAHTAEELHELNQTLLNELTDIQDLASLGQASAEFVHDLRNPLTIVLGYVELLSDQLRSIKNELGPHYGATAKYMDVIAANAERCRELAKTWQHIGGQGSKVEAVALTELFEEIRSGIEFLASSENAEVVFDMHANGAKVLASRSQLARALHNVVTNALHAVPESGGEVRIVTNQTSDSVEIRVEDNGAGIAPENLNRIFEPYFTTKTDGKGTGLGLAITKKILEDCNGSLTVHSRQGEGTCINMRLPLMNPRKERSEETKKSAGGKR